MRVAIAQLDPVVGDIEGNLTRLRQVAEETWSARPDLVIFPELFLTGYPPRDLLERSDFLARTAAAVREVVQFSHGFPETGLLFGAPVKGEGRRGLDNAALLVAGGRVLFVQAKSLLPTYDVFDEARYFDPAPTVRLFPFRGELLGISVCEDAWNDPRLWPPGRAYERDPIAEAAHAGATLFINLSASPFQVGKEEIRYHLLRSHARRHGRPFVYVNQVGANDELVFDGRSIVLDAQGEPVHVGPAFAEEVTVIETTAPGKPGLYCPLEKVKSVHDALVLGIRDYFRKTGFRRAFLGLSGGIDSAVTCCLAAAALGPENVTGVAMPSPYSSPASVTDAERLAANLGVEFKIIPIARIFEAYRETLGPHFTGRSPDVTEENIQARIRGNILMALANKFGGLVLSTGNKSELAVGYCTLYGDMSGGLDVLADVPKTMVYELASYINRREEIIPRSTVEKAPSAELRPGQKDQDTLPPYPVLDAILQLYLEEGLGAEEIVARGFARGTVDWVIRAIKASEYKRRQAPPGIKVTTKAFGLGRRMPIAARW
ncbi:MAG: NAD+ synthase [Firmicutes bacterium]|nr:NAD+ synthase [Bacillota bacterium]